MEYLRERLGVGARLLHSARGHSWTLLALCLTALNLLPIWLVEFPPLQDYPYHLLRVHILANYSNPFFNYPEFYTINFFPLPYSLVDYMIFLLSLAFSIGTSGKIVLSLYVILLPWSVFYFINSVDNDKSVLGFFSFLFVYSWFFNKGFVNFSFSIPLFFFTLGYWWKNRNLLTWKRELILSSLIIAVYLAHLFTFMILAFVFAVLLIFTARDFQKYVRTLLPFLPAVILLAGSFTHNSPTYAGGNDPLVLLYGSLERRISLIASRNFTYFTSFSPDYERKIFLIAGLIAVFLLIANFRALKRSIFLLLLCAMFVLYLVLPEHISYLNYVANRVVIFLPFIALVCLLPPRRLLLKSCFLVVSALLSLSFTAMMAFDYYTANQGLHHYYRALTQIPARRDVFFFIDPKLWYMGQIAPYLLFDAYYLMESGGKGIPEKAVGFIGALRPVQFRHPRERSLDDGAAYPKILTRVLPGGYAVIIGAEEEASLTEVAKTYELRRVLAFGDVALYRKDHTATLKPSPWPPEDHPTGLAGTYDYLLLYQDSSQIDPMMTCGFEHIFSSGLAHVFKRRDLPMPARSGETNPPADRAQEPTADDSQQGCGKK